MMAGPLHFARIGHDDPRWESAFAQLPLVQQDVFYQAGFARLCASTINRSDQVAAFLMQGDAGVTLYPYVERALDALTGCAALHGVRDGISLYGRGGLVTSAGMTPHLPAFHAQISQYCREQHIVCLFDRLHPVIANDEYLPAAAKRIDVGGFVVLDLRPELAQIEAQFKQSVRKDLRKAERNGLGCFSERNLDHLDEFLRIYRETMDRNHARDFYYFPRDFFEGLARYLPDGFEFFYTTLGEKIISCELVLFHGLYSHSFLGGTTQESLPLCANPYLKYAIIRAMKQHGCAYFLLGGGTAPNDGVFNFKRAYAPEGVFPSYVAGTIFDAQAYEAVRTHLLAAGREINAGRFQFYDPN